MAREIKFRGKTESNQFIVGDLIQYENGDTAIFEKKITGYGYEATQISNRTKVYKETIGQYTGLKDCNGNDIYEGDIISKHCVDNDEIYICEWIEKYACFAFIENVEYGNPYYFQKCDEHKLEIIGNIHDNPELIKTK